MDGHVCAGAGVRVVADMTGHPIVPSDREIEAILYLRRRGLPYSRICKKVGRGKMLVQRVLREAGMPLGLRDRAQCALFHTRKDGEHLIWKSTMGTSPVMSYKENGKNRKVSVRKLLYEAEHGELLPGEKVYRTCDVEACVAPSHATRKMTSKRKVPLWKKELHYRAVT